MAEVAIIGAGPAASSLLERIAANATELLGDQRVRVHLVDPHRAGTGRVWRPDNHAGLWMNSLAEDVTMFTDGSVVIDGPIRPGPTLYEWAMTIDDEALAAVASPELMAEIRALEGTTFPTRRVQSAYLDWFHGLTLAEAPDTLEIVIHRARAVDLIDEPDGTQTVILDDGSAPLRADVVVLAMGHLDALPDARAEELSAFARAHGLTHVPAGHTAELEFGGIRPGQHMIALGFGQAFTDLVVLLTEGRGGRFVETDAGAIRYVASGDEPVIHVGSRRGVPYRSKIDYRLQALPAPIPKFLDERAILELLAADHLLDFRRDVLPLVLREVGWAYYHELFHAHPDRVRGSWEAFSDRFERAADDAELESVVADSVIDPQDVFDLERINAPLAGLRFASAEELHAHVRSHVAGDVARRTDPHFSADLGAFNALLQTFGSIARLGASGRMTTRSRVQDVGQWWFSFFMYYASGPPPRRLRQLLALEEAGLVRFIGANTTVHTDDARGTFVATSTSHPDEVVADALVEAVVAGASVSRSADTLIQRLRDRGALVEEVASEGGWSANTGKVVVTGPALLVARADGTAHDARHAIGSFTSRPAAGAFSRPLTNAPTFRQNDLIARTILRSLHDRESATCSPHVSATMDG
ncbi:MAG: hypothetical protein JWM34_2521 [Ilumatobacteraceae bacterium]|nr:hypothetical protein [Ilumatobacteraceae bacterium]